jgi:hypothetical protein
MTGVPIDLVDVLADRGLVVSPGGQLVAGSKRGSGAAFRFTLPLIDLDKSQDS